jgi:hypothetical protein
MRTLTDEDTDLGYLIEIDEFIGDCIQGGFIDYDGFGYYVYDDEIEDGPSKAISPSDIIERTKDYPNEDVTHILWFNR